MANTYTQGELVRCSATFTNSAGTSTDPTTVTFEFSDPSGNKTTYVYGTDAELVKDDTGDYHVDVSTDEGGIWLYRFEGTGTVESASQGYFIVNAANPA